MKTMLEIPDDPFRAAKAKAALEGTKLKDLVAEGLRMVVHGARARRGRRRVALPLIHSAKPGSLGLSNTDIARWETRMEAGADDR